CLTRRARWTGTCAHQGIPGRDTGSRSRNGRLVRSASD
ncbi:MAG: hypothetical protein AVDCRST_MAG70-977, partial [uncultured Thermomicrobiales bacterium]